MDIKVENISKAYGDKTVFSDFSLTFQQGKTYILTGESGKGKTTLLHILLGIVLPDRGTVTQKIRYSAVFQEDRLLTGHTAIENLCLVAKKGTKKQALTVFLSEILPTDSLDKPIEQLSGGMQRRVAVARAMLADSDCVVMDEPFTGMDETTVQTVIAFIYRHLKERTLLIATHQPEALKAYSPEHIKL